MKFLIDTNVFIPVEPSSITDIEELSPDAAMLLGLIHEGSHQVYLHPKSRVDILSDSNPTRQKIRLLAFNKYQQLKDAPELRVFPDFTQTVGFSRTDTNDEVDNNLLLSVWNHAVDIFVSEDRGIHAKARKLGIENRVVRIIDAIRILEGLLTKTERLPPAVEKRKAHSLNLADPIFDSLRDDYPEFDHWFREKCQKGHRDCYVISEEAGLDAVCVLKEQTTPEYGMVGKILKVCTLKVADHALGLRYGELLLKAVSSYAYQHRCDWLYVTAFERYDRVCDFLELFGFSNDDNCKTELGERVFKRRLHPEPLDYESSLLSFHTKFGPKYVHPSSPGYVVPILPVYHRMLFPELEAQRDFFSEQHAFGNSILKAYLCHSNTKHIVEGGVLFFYRSHDRMAIQAVGVVEGFIKAANPSDIASYVGKRTVYAYDQIEIMCEKPVTAILFRQANSLVQALPRKFLESNNVFKKPPQSICKISQESTKCLLNLPRL